ncbi:MULTISPECIES: PTS transporter subunit EIIC [Streptomyces]|uniref:PTS transporter subunit EIIC n=1 Tax=Streptomyces TaxID=1883 RepID=UPI0002D6C768|nr:MULTISPECIES: PTS transporter subunit EIIC [Streptomyces]MCX4484930.1 PTS transporter subunit EIIC [Streptomyces anulatus]MCX4505590.1 PTS transporter subunit EIIC [Streptomyces anulatus]MCX4518579.1 PTS transporter subunit EIIC [Streptomyces anulatus]MCX4601459.1 PTS transporter subunit EIIC [Streptomyces anulatus]OKI57444.1 PTS lactose transporter subunit IIC [Streptomyces sp. CB00072]
MSSSAAAVPQQKWWNGPVQGLQKVGRSLQLPVAVLPAAGLLVSLGNLFSSYLHGTFWDKTSKVLLNGGGAILDGELGLPLLFCIGVAIGFAKKADGSTALAAVVGFLVYRGVLTAFPIDGTVTEALPDGEPQNPGVLGGILIGLLTAVVWQRYHRTKLVDWLGFFNGRRLVPILMAFLCVILGVLFGLLWQPVGDALTWFSKQLIDLGSWGAAIFGFANRLLIPIGMHQFLNTFFWFQAGEYTGTDGQTVQGDISRFFAGDPSAGQFTSGFFPIMMFGLPAAALAITHCARPERRKEVAGLMVSVALTSFVTGVTEPIEFSFMFVAPLLYGVHAVLTGASMGITWLLGVHAGFSFSAGLIDYVVNWHLDTKPWLIIPIGACFAVIYYVVFRFAITKFDLKTPGREPEEIEKEIEKDLTK